MVTKHGRSCPVTRRRLVSIEAVEPRLMLAVFWQGDEAPSNGFTASVVGANLFFKGGETRNYVLVHDIIANQDHANWDSRLVAGQSYIELQHRGADNRLRRGWTEQNKSLGFIFQGGAGNDHFQYIDTSSDPNPRYPRQISAFGGPGDDSLHGFSQDDYLVGGPGNDHLFGELGSDLLYGGPGNDRLWGDGVTNANATPFVDDDYLVGGEGRDLLYGWQGADVINGGDFGDVRDGINDDLFGGQHGDCFYFESAEYDAVVQKDDFNARDGISVRDADVAVIVDTQRSGLSSPSLISWLDEHHPKFNLPYPGNVADPTELRIIMPGDNFNCHAAAVGNYCSLFPIDATTRTPSPGELTAYFNSLGFNLPGEGTPIPVGSRRDQIIVLGTNATPAQQQAGIAYIPSHSVLRLPDGTYVSKLGYDGPLAWHRTLSVFGGEYGTVRQVFEREAADATCDSAVNGQMLPGDVDRNGRFNSADLVRVFQAGKYDDGIPNNATFEEGDWNGDGDFDSADLVLAFQQTGYADAARVADLAQAAVVDSVFKDREKFGTSADSRAMVLYDPSIFEWRDTGDISE